MSAWPATVSEPTPDGWVLRATPGLDRGRSNHALTPRRPLATAEVAPALDRVTRFATRHGIRVGIQVSPEHVHDVLSAELDARDWRTQWPTLVLTGPSGLAGALGLTVEDHASPDWLATWGACEGRADVEAHAATVFAALAGRAWFARHGERAAALAVPGDGLLGLFCLAVAPTCRRTGLGRALVSSLCARAPDAIPYLQVEASNAPALALYGALGFTEAYRYRHRVAPGAASAEQAHDREHPDDDDDRPQR